MSPPGLDALVWVQYISTNLHFGSCQRLVCPFLWCFGALAHGLSHTVGGPICSTGDLVDVLCRSHFRIELMHVLQSVRSIGASVGYLFLVVRDAHITLAYIEFHQPGLGVTCLGHLEVPCILLLF